MGDPIPRRRSGLVEEAYLGLSLDRRKVQESPKEVLDRLSREIAQMGNGELIVRSRIVEERGVRTFRIETFRRVDDRDERSAQRFCDDQDERADGAPHNID